MSSDKGLVLLKDKDRISSLTTSRTTQKSRHLLLETIYSAKRIFLSCIVIIAEIKLQPTHSFSNYISREHNNRINASLLPRYKIPIKIRAAIIIKSTWPAPQSFHA